MKPIHIKRLRKLIAFLRKLPRKRFNFSYEYERLSERQECPTVACAIGWTPKVFPKSVRWSKDCSSTFIIEKQDQGFADVAELLFGIPYRTGWNLFYPNEQKLVDVRLPNLPSNATPKQVARMLEKFIKLQTEK